MVESIEIDLWEDVKIDGSVLFLRRGRAPTCKPLYSWAASEVYKRRVVALHVEREENM